MKQTYPELIKFLEQEKKSYHNWAAVSDILRIQILIKEGGIYLDTDIHMLLPINNSLQTKTKRHICTKRFLLPKYWYL